MILCITYLAIKMLGFSDVVQVLIAKYTAPNIGEMYGAANSIFGVSFKIFGRPDGNTGWPI